MAFSLSPSVEVRERDLSISIPNLPSAKTGLVLRTDTGPANKIIPITSESDLITWFGKPTAANYQDWFQAWNFLQYANSLYVVRPMDVGVGNAGYTLTGESRTSTTEYDLYNADQAELTLADLTISDRLGFYNRYVTSNQSVGFAVCSGSNYWKAPIANEFFGIVEPNALTATTINDLGRVDGSSAEIFLTGGNISLKAGSKFIGNGNKLFTVKNVYSDKILVNANVSAGDISLYVGTPAAANTVVTNGAVGSSTITITFDNAERFNVAANSIFVVDGCQFYVTAIVGYAVTMKKINGTGTASYAVPVTEMYSNSEYYQFVPSSDYTVTTNFVVPAGTTTIKVEAGFNFPVGSIVKLLVSGATYVDLGDTYPEESGVNADNYPVVAVDTLNNTITLDRGLLLPIIILTTAKITDTAIIGTGLRGVNLYSTVYDDNLIVKTNQGVVDAETSVASTIVKESLIPFNNLFDYEPNWVADEFVTVILKKNALDKFELVEKQLASYNPTARDVQNKNIFANEVFYYGSKYMYCKVNTDESYTKVNTCTMALVKFENDYGTPVESFTNETELTLDAYGTVYPLKAGNTAGMLAVDSLGKFIYDANNYKVADVQNATVPFADAESFDVNILIAPDLDMNIMSTIAETRKDCVAIVAPYKYSELVGKIASEATANLLSSFGTQTPGTDLFTTFGTYSAVYGNMKYQYDKYNDLNRWICVAGDIAGLYAQTDSNRDPWWAVAGLERGKIKNAIKLAFNATKQNRDELYVNAINPIISIAGEGSAIVYGQKTATARPSALDRLNVRRLMIVIEKAIATAVKYALFEFNDAFTRSRLVGMIDPFLRTVKARRGVYDYYVQCDAANNPASVLDANGLIIDVYIKPTRVAEFITINFNILRSDANITEFIGGAGA